jgi:cell division transport system permease protein
MTLAALARSALRQAGSAVRAAPVLPTTTALAVAIALVLVGTVRIMAQTASDVLARWGGGARLTVYLVPDVSAGRAAAVGEALRRLPGVARVQFVTSAEAMKRLRTGLGDRSALLDGIEDDFLPPSLEVGFTAGADDSAALGALADRVRKLPDVEDIESMGDFTHRLERAADLVRRVALIALVFIGLGCAYLAFATIRLAVFARKDEIEILRLCGATDRYVRAPFWIEGASAGFFGGVTGIIVLYGLHRLMVPRLAALLPAPLAAAPIGFLPARELALAVGLAVAVGLCGAHWAVRRHLHA